MNKTINTVFIQLIIPPVYLFKKPFFPVCILSILKFQVIYHMIYTSCLHIIIFLINDLVVTSSFPHVKDRSLVYALVYDLVVIGILMHELSQLIHY